MAEHVADFLAKGKCDHDDIAKFVFRESVRNQKAAEKSGRTSVRHSPLMIRLALQVRRKLGHVGGMYAFLARCFGLPSEATLYKYSSPGANSPDGVQWEQCRQHREAYRRKDKGRRGALSQYAWQCHGSLAFDSMIIKEGLCFNHHTLTLVGYAKDAFQDNVILSELNAWGEEMGKADKTEKEVGRPVDAEVTPAGGGVLAASDEAA